MHVYIYSFVNRVEPTKKNKWRVEMGERWMAVDAVFVASVAVALSMFAFFVMLIAYGPLKMGYYHWFGYR